MKDQGISESVQRMVYASDPLARLLMDRFGLKQRAMALIGLGWGIVYLFVLPTIFGSLHSREGYLGSTADWHAQILLLLVFPATCAFYVWQPRAIARVYEAMALPDSALEAGQAYLNRWWLYVSIMVAAGVVAFDSPKMAASYGSWWMPQNWLTILGREASLATAFYVLSMMAWRQFVSTREWRRLLAGPSASTGLKAASAYELTWALLLALLALRLSIEGIELPHRAGALTPDYYFKAAGYAVVSVLCFFTPISGALRREHSVPIRQLVVWFEWAGILALPLLGLIVLRLVLGP
jgi:hypothetical protein